MASAGEQRELSCDHIPDWPNETGEGHPLEAGTWRVGAWWVSCSAAEAHQAVVLACAGLKPHTVIEITAGSRGWVRWARAPAESRSRCPIMWRDGSTTQRWQTMDFNGGRPTESVPSLLRAWTAAEPLPGGHRKSAGPCPLSLSHLSGVCCVGFGDGCCVASLSQSASQLPGALDTMCADMVHEAVAHAVQALPPRVAPLLAAARLLSRNALPVIAPEGEWRRWGSVLLGSPRTAHGHEGLVLLDAPQQREVDRDPLAAEVAALVVATGPGGVGCEHRVFAAPDVTDSQCDALPAPLGASIREHAPTFAAFARLRSQAPSLLGDSPHGKGVPRVAAQRGSASHATLCASRGLLVVLSTPRDADCGGAALLLPRENTAGESPLLGALGAIRVDVAGAGPSRVAAAFPGHGPAFPLPAHTARLAERAGAWPGPAAGPAPLLARVGNGEAHLVLGSVFGAGSPAVAVELPAMQAALRHPTTTAAPAVLGGPAVLLTARSLPPHCRRSGEAGGGAAAARALHDAGERAGREADAWAGAARAFALDAAAQRWGAAGPLLCSSPDGRPSHAHLWARHIGSGDAALAVLDTGHVFVAWRPAGRGSGGDGEAAWLWAAVHSAGLRCRVAEAPDGLEAATRAALRSAEGPAAPFARNVPIAGEGLFVAVLFAPRRGPWVQTVDGTGCARSAGVAPFCPQPSDGGAVDLTCCERWPVPFSLVLNHTDTARWLQGVPAPGPLLDIVPAVNEAWTRPDLQPWRLGLLAPVHAAFAAWAAAGTRSAAAPTRPCRLHGGWALLRAPPGAGLVHEAWVLVSAAKPRVTIVLSAGFHGRLLYATTDDEPPTAFGVLWRRGVLHRGQWLAWDMGHALQRQWRDAVEALAGGGAALEPGPAGATRLNGALALCQAEDAALVVVTRGRATASVLHLARARGHALFAAEGCAVTRVPPSPDLVAQAAGQGRTRSTPAAGDGAEVERADALESDACPEQEVAAPSIPSVEEVVRTFHEMKQGAVRRGAVRSSSGAPKLTPPPASASEAPARHLPSNSVLRWGQWLLIVDRAVVAVHAASRPHTALELPLRGNGWFQFKEDVFQARGGIMWSSGNANADYDTFACDAPALLGVESEEALTPRWQAERRCLQARSHSSTMYRCGHFSFSVDAGRDLLFAVNHTVHYPQVLVLRANAASATFQSRESRTPLPPPPAELSE